MSNLDKVCSLPDALFDDVTVFAIRWFAGTEENGSFCTRSDPYVTLSCRYYFLLCLLLRKTASSSSAITDQLMLFVSAITCDIAKGSDLLHENYCFFVVSQ